jgi:acyl-coenzyme A synthetase/AMP-(fatty) acid ligase
VTNVGQFIGSTEVGIIPVLLPERKCWNYFEWHPVYGSQMQHVAEDIYELVIPYDPSFHGSGVYVEQPQKQMSGELRISSDLIRQSQICGNFTAEPMISLCCPTEKFNPVTMEGIIQGHPLLSGALIVGQGRFQAALMVELKKHTTDHDSLIEEIWPFVQKPTSRAQPTLRSSDQRS